MSALIGTNVAAPIVPTDSADTYPSHYAQYGFGGWRSVADITARNAIPAARREEGMHVYVQDTDTLYVLRDGILDANWQVSSTAGATGIQGPQGIQGIQGDQGIQGVTGAGYPGTVDYLQIAFGDYGGALQSSTQMRTYGTDDNRVLIADVALSVSPNGEGAGSRGTVSVYNGLTGASGLSADGFPSYVLRLDNDWADVYFCGHGSKKTYGLIGFYDNEEGGLFVEGYGSDAVGLNLCGCCNNPNTSDVSSAHGVVNISGARVDAAHDDQLDSLAASDNLFSVRNLNACKLCVKGNGDLYLNSGDVYVGGASDGGDVYLYKSSSWHAVPYAGGATGAAGSAAGYVTLYIDGAQFNLLYQ